MNRKKVLDLLCDVQKDCAPIVVSIGTITDENHVDNERLVIKEAPPTAIHALTVEGYALDVAEDGMSVSYFGTDKAKQ